MDEKEYKIFIPVRVDGKQGVKELKIKAKSVTEAHLAGVAFLNATLENIKYPNDEEQ